MSSANMTDTVADLDRRYAEIERIILSRQDPITGLLPASTAVNAHGDYTDAWVRDNVYSILAVWGLFLAYRRVDEAHENAYLLSNSVTNLMRGLLAAMMRQSDRVELFKKSLDPLDAIHAKFGTQSGLAVVGDKDWGHLQLDATSLYLLMVAQMTASGLRIIHNVTEVNFIQNLVHYISRSYCTPDYGIWERGNKLNHGVTEINGSSVGMAKAALEALSGFNLFGNVASQDGIVHVVQSDIARCRSTLEGLLPRESNSKETDAALLSVVGYPAYAVEDQSLADKTRLKVIKKLAGRFGCKRFLLDGHQSALEDESRLHYEPMELQKFVDTESEWPLFFCYLYLDALMRGDAQEAQQWRDKLEPLFVEQEGVRLLPELYIVPASAIAAEKAAPGSQDRIANENLPLVWAQSLYMLADLVHSGHLDIADIDPIARRRRLGRDRSSTLLVPVLAENDEVKRTLLDLGIASETLSDVAPVQVYHAAELTRVNEFVGCNAKLGLTGRPPIPTRSITSSSVYRLAGQDVLFLPYYFNPRSFYFGNDNELLVEHFRSSLRYIDACWDQPGQPMIAFLVRADMLADESREHVVLLLRECVAGDCAGLKTRVNSVSQLMTTASRERIDDLHGMVLGVEASVTENRDYLASEMHGEPLVPGAIRALNAIESSQLVARFVASGNAIESAEIVRVLLDRHGANFELEMPEGQCTLSELAERYYEAACHHRQWSVIRRLAAVEDKYDSRLEDALLDIVIRHKRLAVGRAFSEKAIFSEPTNNKTILSVINKFTGESPAESILVQEIVLHLAHLIKSEPELFKNMLTLRCWYFIQLIVGKAAREGSCSYAEAYEQVLAYSPSKLFLLLREVLANFGNQVTHLEQQETLDAKGVPATKPVISGVEGAFSEVDDWVEWRENVGMIGRLPPTFYKKVWHLLRNCNGLVVGDRFSVQNRMGTEITHDSTAGERSVAILIDDVFNRIVSPSYRQLNIELVESLVEVFYENAELSVDGDLVLDVIIGYAVKIAWQENHKGAYLEQRGQAWGAFYQLPPTKAREYFIEAIWYLLTAGRDAEEIEVKR